MRPKEETMKHDAKVNVRPESTEKQQGHKPPIQSQETVTSNLANLTQTGLQHLSPADLVRLRGTIGNRAVARLMAQRQISYPDVSREGEEDEDFEGPRIRREGEEDEDIEGPREKLLREDAVQSRGGVDLRSSPGLRGSRVSGLASVGDASNVDGQGMYGWDRPMSATDVANVVNDLVTNQSSLIQGKTIYIFSGTHGTSTGNLVNTGAAGFVGEDQATANTVMAANPGTQIEVIDVPNTYTTKAALTPVFTSTAYVRILAWCYSNRSYNNSATLKANFWPAPDHT
jgi:hypothetical protein